MKEKQVINKLRLLKTIQPTHRVLNDMKEGVYQQVGVKNKIESTFGLREFLGNISVLIKEYKVASYSFVFALLLIIFLSVSSAFLPNQVHSIVLYGRLAFASNQYQRASIALADATSRFGANGGSVTELSQSLALANTQLDNLKLKGEKGKYTAQQCHQIYQEYLSYLEREEKNVSTRNNSSLANVKFQINTYEELAEKKLHMYSYL